MLDPASSIQNPESGVIYISVIGGSSCDEATATIAEQVGRLIAREGAILVCGGGAGVMEAACRGAKNEGGVTIGILPGIDRLEGNSYLDYSITTGLGHGRNLAVAASGDAVIAIGGRFGTLSEVGLAGILKRPVVLLVSWDIKQKGKTPKGVFVASSAEEAINLVTTFTK